MIQSTLNIGHTDLTVPRAQKQASERMSAAERSSEASSAEQVSERRKQMPEQTSEWPIIYDLI